MESDWDAQSIITLIVGFIATVGLWAGFLWTLGRDDIKK